MTEHRVRFFNRTHLVQGLQILILVSSMLGVVFIGLDFVRATGTSLITLGALGGGALCSVTMLLLSRSIRAALFPIISGAVVGLLFLALTWPLQSTAA